jgi:hypothetical protein
MNVLAATSGRTGLKLHGYVGIILIFAAQTLLFLGNETVGRWFTPIVWTGYILFVDALVYRARGRSLLVNDRREFLIIAVISLGNWWLFELYNAPRFWESDLELWWHYHNMESNLFLRRLGYDWAFATISPAMFETAELFLATVFKTSPVRRRIEFDRRTAYELIVAGVIGAALPLIFPSPWLVPLVWLSFILIFDPLNALNGRPSIMGDLKVGDWRGLFSLLAAGGLCGVLWEFWNYWAITKWTYTVPYFGDLKIFEMPVLGYLGFPPFAVGCWATYICVRGWVLGLDDWDEEGICPTGVTHSA